MSDTPSEVQVEGAKELLGKKKSHSPAYLNEFVDYYRMAQELALFGKRNEYNEIMGAGHEAQYAIANVVASEYPDLTENNCPECFK